MGDQRADFTQLIASLLSGFTSFGEENDVILSGEVGGNKSPASVNMGAGHNFFEFTDFDNGQLGERITISAGSGDDVILGHIGADWTGSGSDLTLEPGDGNSSISLLDAGIADLTGKTGLIANKGATISRLNLSAGIGDHDLYVGNAIAELDVSYSAGSHVLHFEGHVKEASLDLGAGYSAAKFGDFDNLALTKGDGDLLFNFGSGSGDLSLSAGDGNHSIKGDDIAGALEIDLGDGDHRILLGEIDEGFRHVNSIRVGDGNSLISFDDFLQDETGSRGRNEVIAGDGDHVVNVNLGHGSRHPGLVMNYTVAVGDGSSTVIFDGSDNHNGNGVRVGTLDIDAGAGSHSVLINAHARNASVDLSGDGGDLVIYDSGMVGRTLVINTHDGDDVVLIDGAGRVSGGENYRIDTGEGTDTVVVYNSAADASVTETGTPLGAHIQNAEMVVYAATNLAATLADLGLVLPQAAVIDTSGDLQVSIDETGGRPVAKLTGTISGRVFAETTETPGFDEDDYGLAFATVVLMQDGLRVDEVRTEADGTYTFDSVALGDYSIAVLPLSGGEFANGSGTDEVSVTRDSFPVSDFGVRFHVDPTKISVFDGFSFEADFDTLLRFGADAEATGVVSYALEGVDAAFFRIDPLTGILGFAPGFDPEFTSPRDANADNSYDVTIVRSGGAFLELPREVVEVTVLDPQIAMPGTITGRFFDDVKGTSLEVGGNGDAPGVANALVVLLNADDTVYRDADRKPITAVTDEYGDYRLEDVPEGIWKVGFEASADRDFVRQGRDFNRDGRSDNRKASDVDSKDVPITVFVPSNDDQPSQFVSLGLTRAFSVASGEIVSDVDAGAISDVRYGTNVSDLMTGTSFIDRLFGLAGNDNLFGGAGDDVLDGGAGNDVLTGGAGQDSFIFRAGDGRSTITDFQIGFDFLDIEGFAGVANDDDLIALARQDGLDTIFDFGQEMLILMGVDVDDLNAGDLCVY